MPFALPMAKQEKVIKVVPSNFIKIRKTLYVRIPVELLSDSAFPLKIGIGFPDLKIKMLKDKLIVEEG